MLQQAELLGRARVRQKEARKMRKIFKEISKEGNAMLPDDGMVRKGMLTVLREKALFSTDQLVKVCEHMLQKLSLLFFKGPADSCPSVVVIFSPNCQYGDVCEVKTRVEIFKKHAAVDNYLIHFKVESVFTPEKYSQHILDRSPEFVIRNKNCDVGKELTALMKTLTEIKNTAGRKNAQTACLGPPNSVRGGRFYGKT